LVDALLAAEHDVLVLDDLSSGTRENLSGALQTGASLSEADVSDWEAVGPAFESFKPEAVFHLAAQIDVRRSMAYPGLDARLNVVGTLNVLEATARAGARRFLFTSTGGAIYGEGQGREDELPFAETARCEPFSVYGQSKLAAEGYLELYRRGRGLSSAALRLGNVYGPRQNPALEAGVVAIFCDLAREEGVPTIFGDGRQTRDYIYVGDVVSSLLAAVDSDAHGSFNVATGVETSVLALAESVGRLTGRDDFGPKFEAPREGEVQRTYLDVSRINAELGWRAARDLDAGLRLTMGEGQWAAAS
jgi:UDP-glucose 4-epimerase